MSDFNTAYDNEASATVNPFLSRFVQFEQVQPQGRQRKTDVWLVKATQSGLHLGLISWYGPWRRYTFTPHPATLFDAECLGEIGGFCKRETEARKEARKEEKT